LADNAPLTRTGKNEHLHEIVL